MEISKKLFEYESMVSSLDELKDAITYCLDPITLDRTIRKVGLLLDIHTRDPRDKEWCDRMESVLKGLKLIRNIYELQV